MNLKLFISESALPVTRFDRHHRIRLTSRARQLSALALGLLLGSTGSLQARERKDLDIVLSARKVVCDQAGRETLVEATCSAHANPATPHRCAPPLPSRNHAIDFVGASLLATEHILSREQARSHNQATARRNALTQRVEAKPLRTSVLGSRCSTSHCMVPAPEGIRTALSEDPRLRWVPVERGVAG